MMGRPSPMKVSAQATIRHSGKEATSIMWLRLMGSVSFWRRTSSFTAMAVVTATSRAISTWNKPLRM